MSDLNYNYLINKGSRLGGKENELARNILDLQITNQKTRKAWMKEIEVRCSFDILSLKMKDITDKLNTWNEMIFISELSQ